MTVRKYGNAIQDYFGQLNITAAPAVGIALNVTGVTGSAVAALFGADIATMSMVSTAATNRVAIAFQQVLGTTTARIGVDGTQALLSDSTNTDLCVVSAGSAIRFGNVAAGTTRMLINAAAVTVNAPASGQSLIVNTATAAGIQATGPSPVIAALDNGANGVFVATQAINTAWSINFGWNTSAPSGNAALQINGTGALVIRQTSGAYSGVIVQTPSSGSIALTVNGVSGTHSTQIADSATNKFNAGFLEIPQNSKSANYTTVLADSGKHIYHPTADVTARTWTIDSNANVPYNIGTAITFDNDTGAGVITLAITTDTLVWLPSGATGSRTLAAGGQATALKVTATRWHLTGVGIT